VLQPQHVAARVQRLDVVEADVRPPSGRQVPCSAKGIVPSPAAGPDRPAAPAVQPVSAPLRATNDRDRTLPRLSHRCPRVITGTPMMCSLATLPAVTAASSRSRAGPTLARCSVRSRFGSRASSPRIRRPSSRSLARSGKSLVISSTPAAARTARHLGHPDRFPERRTGEVHPATLAAIPGGFGSSTCMALVHVRPTPGLPAIRLRHPDLLTPPPPVDAPPSR